jgi:hypothetical protein
VRRGGFRGSFCRAYYWAGAAVHDPQRHFATVNCRSATSLFDHFVGTYGQRLWNGEAKSLGDLEIDDQLEFRRHLDWKIGGFSRHSERNLRSLAIPKCAEGAMCG